MENPSSQTINQTCPKCSSSSVVEIIYGKPDHELMELAERGEVILGGCEVARDNPDFACKSCGHRWLRLKH